MTDAQREASLKLRALRRIAHLYGGHADSRSAMVAVHAAVWADLAAAHATDPRFDEAAVRALADTDIDTDTYDGYTAAEWQSLWRYFIYQVIDSDAANEWLIMAGEPVPIVGVPSPSSETFTGTPFGEPAETVDDALQRLETERDQLTARLFDDVLQGHVKDAERDSESADAAAFQRHLLQRSVSRGDTEHVQAEILWALATAAQNSTTPQPGDIRSRIIRRRATWAWALPPDEHHDVLSAFPPNPLL